MENADPKSVLNRTSVGHVHAVDPLLVRVLLLVLGVDWLLPLRYAHRMVGLAELVEWAKALSRRAHHLSI
jgi:hypothetical protein